MKKFIFMAAMLLVSAFGFAQKLNVKDIPGLDVQFKRCVVNGNNGYFDFLFTNVSSYNTFHLCFEHGINTELYDDEGNILKNVFRFSVGNEDAPYIVDIPKDITIKVRVSFSNLDEYATKFKLLKLGITHGQVMGSYTWGYVELRDVPFVRRDQ